MDRVVHVEESPVKNNRILARTTIVTSKSRKLETVSDEPLVLQDRDVVQQDFRAARGMPFAEWMLKSSVWVTAGACSPRQSIPPRGRALSGADAELRSSGCKG